MRPRPRLGRTLAQLAVVASVILAARPLYAIHRSTPFLVNMSNFLGGQSEGPGPTRGEPIRDAFASTSDLKHNGSTGRQIYYYSLSPPGSTKDSRTLVQVTNTPGDSDHAAMNALGGGSVIAFDSTADILDSGITARQIFLWNREDGTFVQVTNGTADSRNPHLDFRGNTLVFESDADLKGFGGPSGHTQIFVYDLSGKPPCDIHGCDTGSSRLVQVTHAMGDSTNPSVNAATDSAFDGRFVLFESAAAIIGPSNGAKQVYLYDRGDGGRITAISNGTADSSYGTTDSHGSLVAFQSEGDLLGSGGSSGGSQIFILDRDYGILRQVTNGPGNSIKPNIGNLDHAVSFVSTGDLLGTGAVGQHLFFYDPRTDHLFQVTKVPGTISDHPISSGENFTVFDTDEDIMNTGMVGRQVYSLDTFGRIPLPTVGKKTVNFLPQNPTSQAQMQLNIGERDGHSEAPVAVAATTIRFPPIPVAGFGTFCLTPKADAIGVYSCVGGRPGGDLVMNLDHDTDSDDARCRFGCREGSACNAPDPEPFPRPHRHPCPQCFAGTCIGGPNNGLPCTSDVACVTDLVCTNGQLGVCNGSVQTDHVGAYSPGGALIELPVSVSLSLGAGLDNTFCTTDDAWKFKGLDTKLELTTGTVTATIADANDVATATLTATDTGAGFDCHRLEKGNYEGAVLVGELPLLDVPTSPPGIGDVIVGVHLTALGGNPYVPCEGASSCQLLTVCNTSADCNDNNVCNGVETCVNGNCIAGTPPTCDDGNVCNGVEICHPILGCQPGTAISCDDGAICTQDTCSATSGCVHTPIPGCCLADVDCIDTNVCNGTEICVSGNCVSGTPLTCNDNDACNGVESCDPTLGCLPGTAPARFSYEGVKCGIDAVQAAISATPSQLVGGPTRMARYNQSMVGIRKSIGFFNPGGNRPPGATKVAVKFTIRKLKLLSQNMNASVHNGKAYASAVTPITDAIKEAILRLRNFQVGAPQPS